MLHAANVYRTALLSCLALLVSQIGVAQEPHTAPQTALAVLVLGTDHTIHIGALTPKSTRWVGEPTPQEAPLTAMPRCEPHIARELIIVAAAPGSLTWQTKITLSAPGGGRGGDVVDAWEIGGVVARLPWLGPHTYYAAISITPPSGGACVAFEHKATR